MLRKLFTLIVCLVAAVTTASAQTPPDNEIWYTTTDGNVPEFFQKSYFRSISTYSNGKGIIKLDDSIDIDYILKNAFKNCSTLSSITLPKSITSIVENMFLGCSSLRSITIPKSVTEIGEKAFSGCYHLESITIPESVTKIGNAAFNGCGGKLIINCNIPNGYSVNDQLHYPLNGSRFTKIVFGKDVTRIGDYAFYNCFNGQDGISFAFPKNLK